MWSYPILSSHTFDGSSFACTWLDVEHYHERKAGLQSIDSKKRLSLQSRGWEGSMVSGMTRWGEEHVTTLSQREMAPDASLSMIVSEIDCETGLHDKRFRNTRAGGILQL